MDIKIVLLVFVLIVGCEKIKTKNHGSLKSKIDKNLGKTLLLPDTLETYKPFSNVITDSSKLFGAKLKIYSHVNTSCGNCTSDIESWNRFALKIEKYKVPVILICDTDDNFEQFKFNYESGKIMPFKYPFFLDHESEYVKLNQFMAENDSFKTVLTDSDNNILLLGSPILSKGLEELYINEIQKRSGL